jgi:outer membrane protein TolC
MRESSPSAPSEVTQAWNRNVDANAGPAGPATASAPRAVDEPAATEPESPLNLSRDNIIQRVFQSSPPVAASREEKQAAVHQLEEFKANLSRLEPFVEANATLSEFPKRQDAAGRIGEIIGGIEKEMFDGARLRAEGGASASRFEFGDVARGEDDVESGGGALVRGSVEVPFVGSRLRQNRIISQAFQESTARRAELDYLSIYRSWVTTALSYYAQLRLYKRYGRAYELQQRELTTLLEDPRLKPGDQVRLESSIVSARVLEDQYQATFQQELTALLATLGVTPDTAYVLDEPAYKPSPYIEQAGTPEGLKTLLDDAYDNNPTFRVLDDAIRNARIQRDQAIAGKLDITVFGEGTQFPFGSETFDDRVRGWTVSGGVRIRLNDPRVLTATRLKAEAQIRQFEAESQRERRDIESQVITETNRLRANDRIRDQILELIESKQGEFLDRSRRYLTDPDADLTIDDVLLPLSELTSAKVRLSSNEYSSLQSGTRLMAATGEVYRMVGMKIENGDVRVGDGTP